MSHSNDSQSSHDPNRTSGHPEGTACAGQPTAPEADHDLARLRRAAALGDFAGALSGAVADLEVEWPALDLNALLWDVEPSLRLTLATDVLLTVRPACACAVVRADRDELEALVRRLIVSTAQAMPQGGNLTVSTGFLDCIFGGWPHDRVPPRRYVRLTVADAGAGNNAETWWRVLAPLTEEGAAAADGEGIAAIVRRLGGYVMVEGTDSEGSRIHACLPNAVDDVEG